MPDPEVSITIEKESRALSGSGNGLSIAVVIAAKNAGAHLGEALESIMNQSDAPDEVVVFSDGSTDDTLQIAEQFRDRLPNLKLLTAAESVGISQARNRANESVSSDYIAILDADDLLSQEAIEIYRSFLQANPDTDLLYGDTHVFSDRPSLGKRLRYPTFSSGAKTRRAVLASPRLPMKHSSMIYRKEAFDRIGRYDERLPLKVDIDLFLRFFDRQCRVAKLEEATSFHRKHTRQISTRRFAGIPIFAHLILRYEPNPLIRPFLLFLRVSAEIVKQVLRG